MDNIDFINDFFNKITENKLNIKILNDSYNQFDYQITKEYISKLLSVNLKEYLDYLLLNKKNIVLMPEDICQFSCFEDCTTRLCKKFVEDGNKGYDFLEIGRLLKHEGMKDNESSLRKYGENHTKTALLLGLLAVKERNGNSRKFALSSIGQQVNNMSEEELKKIYARLVVRTELIKKIYPEALDERIYMDEKLYCLKGTTYVRRRPNIKMLIQTIFDSNELLEIDWKNNIIL